MNQRQEKEVLIDSQVRSGQVIFDEKNDLPDCQLLLLYGEDGQDYNISPPPNVPDNGNEKKPRHDNTNTKAYKSAKKVYLKYMNLHKMNVQAGTSLHSSTNDDDDNYGNSDEENYHYSDEENYLDSSEESYVDVAFERPMPREKKIKKETKTDFVLPKKCRRPDVCYIMKLCIYCKPFFKKQLKNG